MSRRSKARACYLVTSARHRHSNSKASSTGTREKEKKKAGHMTFLSRDFNMAAPDSVDSKSNTESTVIETENIQDSPVFSDGQVKDKRCSSSR